jgi:adenylate cyclase
LSEARHVLEGNTDWRKFPLLVELHAQGVTDFLILRAAFTEVPFKDTISEGVMTTWSTTKPGGFSDIHLTALKRLIPRLAVATKMARGEDTVTNILTAYLGGDAAKRVLAGQIRRGDGEVIPSVIWYSDLRKSTTLADTLPGEEFLAILNAFFECTAGAVLDHDGDVLRFIGDAVMAIFPVGGDNLCQHDAEARLAEVNKERAAAGKPALALGLGLHVGEVMFGNIGTPERLEFSVIGPAANEVTRLEALTKDVGRSLVVSAAFAKCLDIAWESLGEHEFKGVAGTRELFAPPPPSATGK